MNRRHFLRLMAIAAAAAPAIPAAIARATRPNPSGYVGYASFKELLAATPTTEALTAHWFQCQRTKAFHTPEFDAEIERIFTSSDGARAAEKFYLARFGSDATDRALLKNA